MILSHTLPWVTGAFALAMLLNAWRLLRGPGLPDRIPRRWTEDSTRARHSGSPLARPTAAGQRRTSTGFPSNAWLSLAR